MIEDRVNDLPRLLRVSLGKQLHQPLQISEQHRDLLAIDWYRLRASPLAFVADASRTVIPLGFGLA